MEAVLKKEIIVNKQLCRILAISVFVVLTALGAFVRIPLPFSPVPITMQTLFVLLSGALLGTRLGFSAQISYIFLGALGFSVFTGAGSGLVYLSGPTAGYLAGFVLAALFAGRFIKIAKENIFFILGILFIADLILLFCGIAWLKLLFDYPFQKLLMIGLLPFLPGDLLKASLASFLYLKLKNRFREVL